MGQKLDKGEVYVKLFNAALTGDKDAGGLVSIPFISGETVMGVQTGYPLVVRGQNANFTIANFMRMNIMAAFGALAAGNEVLRAEDVKIDKLYGHGGIFKTPKVAQSLLAAALEAPGDRHGHRRRGRRLGPGRRRRLHGAPRGGASRSPTTSPTRSSPAWRARRSSPTPPTSRATARSFAAFRKANEAEKAAEQAFTD